MKETAAGYRVWGSPELEDAVDVDEMAEEAAILVPAFACTDGTEEGNKARKGGIDNVKLRAEEREGNIKNGEEFIVP